MTSASSRIVRPVRTPAESLVRADNPAVAGAPHFRYYAGAPIVDEQRFALGSLCVIDTRARTLDPVQAQIFTFMPIVFTFMLGSFPAGLVIYWAWNNLLSVIQQGYIMRRNGVKVELFDNMRSTFSKKPSETKS